MKSPESADGSRGCVYALHASPQLSLKPSQHTESFIDVTLLAPPMHVSVGGFPVDWRVSF